MYFSQELNSDIPVKCRGLELTLPNPHWHEHYEIIFVEEGKVCVFIENAENPLVLEKGDILLLEPNMFHSPV